MKNKLVIPCQCAGGKKECGSLIILREEDGFEINGIYIEKAETIKEIVDFLLDARCVFCGEKLEKKGYQYECPKCKVSISKG